VDIHLLAKRKIPDDVDKFHGFTRVARFSAAYKTVEFYKRHPELETLEMPKSGAGWSRRLERRTRLKHYAKRCGARIKLPSTGAVCAGPSNWIYSNPTSRNGSFSGQASRLG
jgi:hypothetical protein